MATRAYMSVDRRAHQLIALASLLAFALFVGTRFRIARQSPKNLAGTFLVIACRNDFRHQLPN